MVLLRKRREMAFIYRFHKINSCRQNSIIAYEIVHYIANSKERRSRIRPYVSYHVYWDTQ